MPDQPPMSTGLSLPLRYDEENEEVRDADNRLVFTPFDSDFGIETDTIHMAEIVAACNSYRPLLAALESCERTIAGRTDDEANLPSDLRALLAEIREALASAKGGAA